MTQPPNPEYVVWGISPQHGPDEALLVTGLASPERAERVMRTLREQHGCHTLRIQKIDLTQSLEWDARKLLS